MKDRILIFDDHQESKKELDLLKNTLPQLQDVVTEFSKLGEKHNKKLTLELGHLTSFFKDGGYAANSTNYQTIEMTMITQLFPEGKIGGAEIRLDKISSFFKTPDITPVLEACRKVSKDAYIFFQKEYFTLKSGKVGIVPGTKESIIESYRTYTESEEENERYHAAKAMADAINKVISLAKEGIVLDVGDLDRALDNDPVNERYIPGGSFVKFGALGSYVSGFDIIQRSKTIRESKLQKSAIGTPIQTGDWSGFDTGTPDPIPSPTEQTEDDFIKSIQDMNK